ncbi:IclR family transcriptional regulator [Pseudemcibacter aquimaris]|uniref:IclR family transcriptional regulator n=1 Tax=Pseudemcibacter aquimaris TaxID=2857064 RepID=UPI0020121652|nr:IclR family transcriptional regulator [Pseudemcibacter aquimaris]MCC3860974.1 IclR family transcriptional regulator [Pseudemcibacter aquimaris]WDU59792.1 IclR family transcriptional regulator [Pseudemcibacter aquimaris]
MTETLHKNHDRYFIPGLSRGLKVLEIIAEAKKPLTIAEIGKKLGVSRSSAFRITYTLEYLGFLLTDQSGKLYSLGPRVMGLGFSYLNDQGIINIARPHLEKLRDLTKVSSHLAIRDGAEVLYLDNIAPNTSFVSNISTGERRPVYASVLGWMLLAGLGDSEIIDIFGDDEFTILTEHTPKTIDELIANVRKVSVAGYAVSRGFVQKGGSTITAPIKDESGKIIAVIDISGPDSAYDFEKMDSFYVPAVVETASEISRSLGYKS